MAKLIPVPKLGQSEETVSIVKWHKSEGDEIRKGDVLFEVETDKSVLEVESQFEGTLLKIVLPAGEEVPVMSVAAVVGKPGEDIPPIEQPKPAAAEKPARAPKAAAQQQDVAEPKGAGRAPGPPSPAAPPAPAVAAPIEPPAPRRKALSPRARKFASDYLIDAADVPGTGPGGRVVERDVKAYLEDTGYFERKITPAAHNVAAALGLRIFDIRPTGVTGRITVSDVRRAQAEQPQVMPKIRQTIARRLQLSKQTIPHFYVTVNVDMTDLIQYRQSLKETGYTTSINDFVAKAVALALCEFPAANSCTEDGVHLKWNSEVNLGIAVNIEGGLVVPVLRNADRMTLDELHDAAKELAGKARSGKLTPADMEGGTFTLSNMGMLKVDNFAAIINPGESSLLAVASAAPAAVVNADREVTVRDMMKITLSADHRVVDGAVAAGFVNAVKNKLEDIELWKQEIG